LYRDVNKIETVRPDANGDFRFTKKLSAGKYRARAVDAQDDVCWEKQEQIIDVDETASVHLAQKGYQVKITSTHDNLKLVGDIPLTLHRGENLVCVNKASTIWKPQSDCWVTDAKEYSWKREESVDVSVVKYVTKGNIRVEGDVNASDVTIRVQYVFHFSLFLTF
jgi:hypothetical protein